MGALRVLVLAVSVINFMLALGFGIYGMTLLAEIGTMNTLLTAIFVWAVLSAFCNVCVVYWVATSEDEYSGSSEDDYSRVRRLEGLIDDNFAILDERLKKLEPSPKPKEKQEQLRQAKASRLVVQSESPKVERRQSPVPASLVEKLSKKGYLHPENVIEGFINSKTTQGKTREQAIKELEEEYG